MKNNGFQIELENFPISGTNSGTGIITKYAICITLFLSIVSLECTYSQTKAKEDEILKAYKLRMLGNEKEAQANLELIIKDDPTYAMAHFEMARTVSEKKWHYYNKAIQYDPKNPMYVFDMANLYMLWAYMAMHEENMELVNHNIGRCCATLKNVLEIKPYCRESLLFLIDIYGTLPEEEGGNRKEAEKYLQLLQQIDPVYAARGQLILASEDIDVVNFWQDYMDQNGETSELLVILGKSHLGNDQITEAEKCFNKVLAEDPSQAQLYLHLARAFMYRTMRGESDLEDTAPLIKKYFNLYLDGEDNKPIAIEAWCYGWLSVVESKQGNKEEADLYLGKANALNPDFSKATAIPEVDQPPNVIAYTFSSYFSPF